MSGALKFYRKATNQAVVLIIKVSSHILNKGYSNLARSADYVEVSVSSNTQHCCIMLHKAITDWV